MKIGLESTAYFGFEDFEAGMKKMRSHGYDGFDYQGIANIENSPVFKMTEGAAERYLTEVKECAAANGLEIYQLHGVWPHVDDATQEGREKTIEYLKQNIVQAKILGCPNVIVHPCMPHLFEGDAVEEEDFELNRHLLRSLAPVAEENNVTVCFENMPFCILASYFAPIPNIKKLLQEVNNPYIKVCLDTGHFNATGKDIYSAIKMLGDDLVALHVHDDRHGQDRHLIPFQGEVDWDGFVRGLKEVSYKGFMSLETMINTATPQPMLDEMRISLAKIARHLADAVEK